MTSNHVSPPASLNEAINAYLAARHDLSLAANVHDDAAYEMPVWSDFQEAERALVNHPCANEEDRRGKIAFALADREFCETLDFGRNDGGSILTDFLRSLA